ncbi:MAG: hypothetical protein AABW63_02635 [Nanoarchaeota archaeon]
MIGKRDKKGQGLSSETIILLLIAVVVLVIVILGFTKGWGWVFGGFGLLPGDLEKSAQACDLAGQNNLKTTYCNEFKEVKISGKTQFLNCEELTKYATFTTLSEACDGTQVKNLAKQLCVNQRLDNSTEVNGISCQTLRA